MNGGATYIPWVDFEPKLEGWRVLIKSPANGGVDIIAPYFNSLFVTCTASLISIVLGTLSAYALSRFTFKAGFVKNNEITFFFMSQRIMPPIVLSIPFFLFLGYTVCNDFAIRDYLENYYRPNLRVKSRDSLCPIGPWLIDKDDVGDITNLKLTTHVNGELTQEGTTADIIFDVPFLVEYLSKIMTLKPGDMIATGTPKGLKDMQPGDTVVCEIEKVGALTTYIVSEQAFYGDKY